MTTDFAAITMDLEIAFAHHLERQRRRRRRLRLAGVAAFVATSFSTAAVASGIGGDLQLDPTKWSILGGGSVDDGRGAYVHAASLEDGSGSTFLVEHDAGLPAYQAFLLHEKTLAAAQSTSPVPVRPEPGELCTPEALTQAETVALATLRSGFPAGATADATRSAVDASLQGGFANAPCRGLEYAGEQARLVYAGVQPASTLMPGVL